MSEMSIRLELYKCKVDVGSFKVGDSYQGFNELDTLYPLRRPKNPNNANPAIFSFVGEQIARCINGDFGFLYNAETRCGKLERKGYPACDFYIADDETVLISSDHDRDALKAYVIHKLCTDSDFAACDDGTVEGMFRASDVFYFKYAQNRQTLKFEKNANPVLIDLVKPDFLKPYNYMAEPAKPESETKRKKRGTVPSVKKVQKIWNDIKAGQYRIFSFGNEALNVPDLSFLESYVPTQDYFFLVKHISYRMNKIKERVEQGLKGSAAISDDAVNFSLIGPPGTGKSVMAKAVAATFGLPFGITRNSSDTDIDEYEGKTRLIDGTPSFCDTDSTIVAMNGGILANEEANLTPNGVITGALNQFAEKPFVLKRNGYENVERHPYTILCNLFNPTVRGGQIMNQSYISRFPVTLDIQAPTDDEMAGMLLSKFSADTDEIKGIDVPDWYEAPARQVTEADAKLANALLKESVNYLRSMEAEDLALVLSTRQCIAFLQLLEEGFPKETAFRNTFVNALKCIDTEQDRDDSVSAQYEREFIKFVFPANIWNTVQ